MFSKFADSIIFAGYSKSVQSIGRILEKEKNPKTNDACTYGRGI